MLREQIALATKQIEFARTYTLGLLEDVDDDEWFRMPANCPTHIGWQVGHLAMAQYALTMIRVRGKEPEDEQIISKKFFRCFQKGTVPESDASVYPTPADIRQTLTSVHDHALQELTQYSDADLEQKLPEPHAVFDTKLGSVFFCSAHELIHCGQIGLCRRLLEKSPIR